MNLVLITLQIIFFASLLGVMHTYVFYPGFMHLLGLLSPSKKSKAVITSVWPSVDIIFAAYNEEAVIEQKLRSSFDTSYPQEKLRVRVGSDASNDRTDQMIQKIQQDQPGLYFTRFEARTGKAQILNQLASESNADLIIFTDANIIFQPETISRLVAAIQDSSIGIAGGTLVYTQTNSRGISLQENSYLRFENSLKSLESRLLGCAMGAEGGCYIIRRELFSGIPANFYMEDFYITMHVLRQGYKVIMAEGTEVFEDVSVQSSEEYKRKVRISIGNFQNLKTYGSMILSRFFPVGLVFFSHKILRWITPMLLISMLMSVMFLAPTHPFFALFAGSYMVFIGLGLFGILFSQRGNAGWLKYPGHFLHMNLALLEGFFIFIKGVESNVWQPTKRNQD